MTGMSRSLPADADTLALGGALAAGLTPGMVVYLSGELGAGKTTLVRGVLRGLGYEGKVKSPTFTLVEVYEVSRLYLYHFDFYRFSDPRELGEAGFREYFNPRSVCLVEWPEKSNKAAGCLRRT
jgi:tRNA threonylcarbamoyladenosine biosynthesis protein TsaE